MTHPPTIFLWEVVFAGTGGLANESGRAAGSIHPAAASAAGPDPQDRFEGSVAASAAHLARLRRGAGSFGDAGGTAAVVHLGIEAVALFFEARHHGAFERAAARQLDTHRVDEAAVDQDFIVDVGAGRHAGRSDEADHLALAHALARLHALGKRRHMAV